MKICLRIQKGNLIGWTIRKSKYNWFSLYSKSGISQTKGKLTLDQVLKIIKEKQTK